MDLEEHTLETAGERCEECGAKLTEHELRVVLESGGPTLCAIHAAEVVPVADEAGVVVGGDVCWGPMPAGCLARLRDLGERARWLRGNADREVAEPPEGDTLSA